MFTSISLPGPGSDGHTWVVHPQVAHLMKRRVFLPHAYSCVVPDWAVTRTASSGKKPQRAPSLLQIEQLQLVAAAGKAGISMPTAPQWQLAWIMGPLSGGGIGFQRLITVALNP